MFLPRMKGRRERKVHLEVLNLRIVGQVLMVVVWWMALWLGDCRTREEQRDRGDVQMLGRVCCLLCLWRGWKLVVRLRESGSN